MARCLEYEHQMSLERRPDEDATRELVAFFLDGDPGTRHVTARALSRRRVPYDLRRRVGALILDDTFDGQLDMFAWPLLVAAEALLDDYLEPEAAFALAEPLLHMSPASRPFDRLRARMLVVALERTLARWTTDTSTAWFVDPRFRPLCEQLQRDDPSMADVAASAIDGFRHFAGEDTEPVARTVDLGEDEDPPFPFLVAGFPVETSARRAEIAAALPALARGRPRGLAWFEHQYGGYCCMQEQILGYGVVVLEAAPIMEALAALSEIWAGGRGVPMTPPELLACGGRLAAVLPPEGAESGTEALIWSPPCSPIETLRGREVLGFGYEGAPWRGDVDCGLEPDITPCGPYGDDHERLLLRLGEALGLGRPRVALLWGNSD